IATSFAFGPSALAHEGHGAESNVVSTQKAMRDLWVDHIFWVRGVLFASARKDKAARAAAEKQVVENAKSIAKAIEPFYGKKASDKLFELLAGHYGAINDYIKATIPSPKAKKQKAAVDKLTANASEIATF